MASLKVGTGLDAPISEPDRGCRRGGREGRAAGRGPRQGQGRRRPGLGDREGPGVQPAQGGRLPLGQGGPLRCPGPAGHRRGVVRGRAPARCPKSVLETVHGPDDRVKISSTGVYPWRAHASLLITARDGSMWIGTGWFIGPHTLMTAGHVVYIKNSGVAGRDGFVRSIKVMPGRNGDDAALRLGHQQQPAHRAGVGQRTATRSTDYGAIILGTDLGASPRAGSGSGSTTTPP